MNEKTNVELFVEDSIANHLNFSKETLEDYTHGSNKETEFGISISLLIELAIAVITVLVKNCSERNKNELVASVKNPGPLRKAKFSLMLRQHLNETNKTKRWAKEARELTESMHNQVNNVDDIFVSKMIDEVSEEEWWLI